MPEYDDNPESQPYCKDGFVGKEYQDHNIMSVEVKTDGTSRTKDKSSKTYIRFANHGCTQWSVTADDERIEHPDEIELELTGDSELDMFIDAFRFMADELEKQQKVNQREWDRKWKQKIGTF